MGNKHKESNIDLYFENIKNESSDEKGTLDIEMITEFSSKALICTCKIILENGYGSGFFCRIPLGDKKELVNFLFTCHHVLTQKILASSEYIILQIKKKEIKLPIKNRRIYSNPELDYSCIEILDKDDIEDFYSIDDSSLKKNFSSEYYLDKLVIIFAIMKNKRPGLSNGLIKSVKNGQFIYTCNTYPGSSGGVIVNQNTNCIIGMHRGECKEANKKKKNLNIGIFMRSVIDDINSNNSNLEKYIENNKDNEKNENINVENNKIIDNMEYKVIFSGNCGSGAKTSLISRFVNNKFEEHCQSTCFCTQSSLYIETDLGIINLQLCDTPGQKQYKSLINIFSKDSHCAILGFDITNYDSFNEIKEFRYNDIIKVNGNDILIYLVANKIDLGVNEELDKEAMEYAKKKNIKYFKISSKTGEGVNLLLKDISNSLIRKYGSTL